MPAGWMTQEELDALVASVPELEEYPMPSRSNIPPPPPSPFFDPPMLSYEQAASQMYRHRANPQPTPEPEVITFQPLDESNREFERALFKMHNKAFHRRGGGLYRRVDYGNRVEIQVLQDEFGWCAFEETPKTLWVTVPRAELEYRTWDEATSEVTPVAAVPPEAEGHVMWWSPPLAPRFVIWTNVAVGVDGRTTRTRRYSDGSVEEIVDEQV